MVTIEEEARKLFEKGKKPDEVFDILSKDGIKASSSTIETYYKVWRRGFKSQSEYQTHLAKKKGFKSRSKYREDLAKKKGFKNYSEYQTHLAKKKGFESLSEYLEDFARKNGFENYFEYSKYSKDPYFKEIYHSNGSDGINEDNPYILMSRISEMEYRFGEGITETEEYKKLEEILKNIEPTKRLKYIGKLKRGVEILKQLGKIDYGSFSILYSV